MEFSGDVKKRLSCMKTFPQELVVEILSWLSIKYLYPLRFVSKSWFQLLTKDSQFAKLQFDRFMQSNPNPSLIALEHSNNSNLLLATEFESCDKALTLQVPFYQHTNQYRISGNCNGLLCFNRNDCKEVYIWNPLINDHITISCLPAPPSGFYATSTGFGFGFDRHSNVYKVVRFFSEIGFAKVSGSYETWTQISVYTIGVDTMWRTVQVDLPCILRASRIAPLVNGVLHWHTRRLHTPHNLSCDVIFTFNLKTGVIDELPPPSGIKFREILELGGLLCVVHKTVEAEMQLGRLPCAADKTDKSEMHIWVMKEYGQVTSWSKQYIIAKRQGLPHFFPLGVTGNNREIIMDNTLVLYRPETNTVRDLKRFQRATLSPCTYIGSIISPTVISKDGHDWKAEEGESSGKIG